MSQRVIAIWDTATGLIRQVTKCLEADAVVQHLAWPGHDYLDVTEACPDATPASHMVDPGTLQIVPRSAPLAERQAAKLDEMSRACAAAIIAGFHSSALGSSHFYPSNGIDQANMVQNAVAGGAFMAQAEDESWALTEHDAAQSEQVLVDFVTHRDTQREALVAKHDTIAAAATIEEVEAVIWGGAP